LSPSHAHKPTFEAYRTAMLPDLTKKSHANLKYQLTPT
jgi:hypothetical protein